MTPKDEIIKIVKDKLAEKLPDLKPEELEENGKVYYMNDRNDTIFDWTMNAHLCPFMCFYADSGMGAIKVTPYGDGKVSVDLYENKAQKPFITETTEMDAGAILDLGVFLYFSADMKDRFGRSLDDLEYIEPTEEMKAEFDHICSGEE